MSDYNSGFTGDRVVELLNMIPNLAKADLSNAMTVSLGQNGYAKFNNGLLIQWGYSVGYSSVTNLYFPISFKDNTYSFTTGVYSGFIDSITSVNSVLLGNRNTGYIPIKTTYILSNNAASNTWSFYWIAIGRWK